MIIYMLGGSNSVFKNGLSTGLEEELKNLYGDDFTFYNKALYGTPSLRHINQLMADIDIIKKSDVIITESNINDVHRYKASRYSVSLDKTFKILSLYYELLSSFNKKVLVIIMNYVDTEKTKSLVISNMHRYFIDKYGFSYIDIDQYYHVNLSKFYDLYYANNNKQFINNFSSDRNHELIGIMRSIGRNIIKNLILIKKNTIIYSKPSLYEIYLLNVNNTDCSFVENVSYFYKDNTYNESLINITNNKIRLYINNEYKYKILGIQTFCRPKNNIKINEVLDGFFSSYIIEAGNTEYSNNYNGGGGEKEEEDVPERKVVKFSRLGMQYEFILKDVYCSKFIELSDNTNDIPLTERSFYEIQDNKAVKSTKNYDLFVHSVLLCKQFDNIYVDSAILESCSIYQSTNLSTLNLNNKILTDLSVLIDIFYGNWEEIYPIRNLFNQIKFEKENIENLFNKTKSEKEHIEFLYKKAQLMLIHYQKETISSQKRDIEENNINYNKKDLKLLSNPYKYFLDSNYVILKIFSIFFYKNRNKLINKKQKKYLISLIISMEKLSNKSLKKKLVYFIILLFNIFNFPT